MGRVVVLSGPSCVGKGPLFEALKRFHPHIAARLHKLVLYNSRAPRPIEVDGVDYHFRTREEIEALRGREGFVVMESRSDLGALDLRHLAEVLKEGDAFFEGAPPVALRVMECAPDVERLTIFLSPLSREEIEHLKPPDRGVPPPAFVAELMRRKLLRRTRQQKGTLSLPDLRDIETRCTAAYGEMKNAWRFDHVLVNHDGEDSDHWTAPGHPIDDARKTLLAFVDLLEGREPAEAEHWTEDLLSG